MTPTTMTVCPSCDEWVPLTHARAPKFWCKEYGATGELPPFKPPVFFWHGPGAVK
jgi:hypothetical protein